MSRRPTVKILLLGFLLLMFSWPAWAQEGPKKPASGISAKAAALISQGFDLISEGRNQEAVAAFKQALKRQPDSYEAYYGLGWAYINLRQFAESLEASQEAVRLKPDYAEAHHHLGMAYERLGRAQEAIPAFKEAIRLKPNAHSYEGLGWSYSRLSRWPEAAGAFEQAVRLNPDEPSLRGALVGCYLGMGDREAALKEYQTIKKLDPKTAQEVAARFPGLVQ